MRSSHAESIIVSDSPDWCSEEDDRQVATRVRNSAARIVSNTRKCDWGFAHVRRRELHWLDVVDWVRFGSESAFRCWYVCTTWLLDTCPLSASPSPAFLVADTCDQLTAVIWTFPVPDWLHTADVHLLTPAHQTGTHFLPTSEIIVFLCQLSNATLRPFSSLSISTRNAFGFFYENALLLLKWRAVIVSNIHISSSSSSSKPMTHWRYNDGRYSITTLMMTGRAITWPSAS